MKRFVSIVLVLLLAAGATRLAAADEPSTPALAADPWETIVAALADGREIVRTEEDGAVTYAIPSGRPGDTLVAAVSVAASGAFLDRADYDNAYAAAPEGERRRDFPGDGARSMVSQVSVGPGGSATTIVSTTADERYDLKVTVADAGSAEPPPDVGLYDVFALNRRLHHAYETAAEQR